METYLKPRRVATEPVSRRASRAAGRAAAAVALLTCSATGQAAVSDFEGLGLPPGSVFYPEEDATFQAGAAVFEHGFTDFAFIGADGRRCCFSGWTYSSVSDSVTPGPANQFAAFPGAGAAGSDTYAIANGAQLRVDLVEEIVVVGGYVANTTYAALAMRDGDVFAKQFGGADGTDPDFLLLTIVGLDAADTPTGAVITFLADYRASDPAGDYILDAWEFVDLSSLGPVAALEFSLSGSDLGAFGLNTPAYFALDDLTVVPLPGAFWLLISGLSAAAARSRWPSRRG